jgi:imidazoleglycerol phosphate dehydratase HisB
MHTKNLIMAQQTIAMARIGLLPTQEACGRALAAINAAQEELRRSGHSALDLDSARAAASVLALGHRPHKDMCIAAVQSIAAVLMRAPQDVEEVQS